METKKNDVTLNQLILLMAKYIKEQSKDLTETYPSKEVNIMINNWHSCGPNGKWKYDEIIFNRQHYNFYDKEIGRTGLIKVVNDALKESGVKGKVKTKEWEKEICHGWHSTWVKHVEFDGLIIYGDPCKEFRMLQNIIKKYSGTELKECQIYYADVCGKRNSWHESSKAYYLDFDKRSCQQAINFIRNKRTSRDKVECKILNSLTHDDEYDYQHSMRYETEWYGTNINYLEINIITPTGKNKGTLKLSTCNVY